MKFQSKRYTQVIGRLRQIELEREVDNVLADALESMREDYQTDQEGDSDAQA